jgi:bifunctional DNase/RNase
MTEPKLVDVALSRVVIRDGADRQYIYLSEIDGPRGFPIVIGNNEAGEIHRVVHEIEPERPLTHALAYNAIQALGARLKSVDIVDLKQNTFYARVLLASDGDVDGEPKVLDARPSDAIALALRAKCQIRVAESVLAKVADTKEP